MASTNRWLTTAAARMSKSLGFATNRARKRQLVRGLAIVAPPPSPGLRFGH
jgi:hypothetical protein